MADGNGRDRVRLQKRGAYQGGVAPDPVPPPPKTPSGSSVAAAVTKRRK